MLTYSDLVAYQECPRAWAYSQEWRPVVQPEAMTRGTFTHAYAAAHWRGTNPGSAVEAVLQQHLDWLERHAPEPKPEVAKATKAAQEAMVLGARYVSKYGTTPTPLIVETTIDLNKQLGGTPDMVGADEHGNIVVVELKTGADPNITALDHTGQPDYYSLLWNLTRPKPVSYLYIDIVSPDYIYRNVRPPRIDRAAYIFKALRTLATDKEQQHSAKDTPHYSWQCGKCPFLRPCKARDDGDDEHEVLMLMDTAGPREQ